MIDNNKPIAKKLAEIEDPNVSISQRRQDVKMHHSLMYEKRIMRYIAEGNKEEFGLLSKKSHLRNKKNIGISAITLATRAAMDGGLFHEVAYA